MYDNQIWYTVFVEGALLGWLKISLDHLILFLIITGINWWKPVVMPSHVICSLHFFLLYYYFYSPFSMLRLSAIYNGHNQQWQLISLAITIHVHNLVKNQYVLFIFILQLKINVYINNQCQKQNQPKLYSSTLCLNI